MDVEEECPVDVPTSHLAKVDLVPAETCVIKNNNNNLSAYLQDFRIPTCKIQNYILSNSTFI